MTALTRSIPFSSTVTNDESLLTESLGSLQKSHTKELRLYNFQATRI
jgi:hypothetical protein